MDQKMSIFVSMMPEEVASHLIKTWKTYSSDQDLENEVMDILKNEEMKPKPKGKALGAVTDDPRNDENEAAKTPMYYWDDIQQGFIGMTVPAGKRRRENDEEDDHKDEAMDGQKGGGKGKGPTTGCFTCGGAHYASNCPKGKGKGKDAGKGGKQNNWFTPRQWSGWYPGPSHQQWNSWYPHAGKGKGKGKINNVNDFPGMSPDGNKL